jgi:hypothetical protein
MRVRRIATLSSLAAATVMLAAFVAPLPARAWVSVEPPTGDVEPALLAELGAALADVVAGAAAAYGVDASLRVEAIASGEEVVVAMELRPAADSEPLRASRTVAAPAAVAQARILARELIRAAAPGRTALALEETGPSTGKPTTARSLPPLDSPYDRSRAFWLSFAPTLGGIALGVGFIGLGAALDANLGLLAAGSAISGLAIAVGPSLGHFYVGNYAQAGWCLALRTAFGVAAPLFLLRSVTAGFADGSGSRARSGESEAFLALGVVSAAALGALAIFDIATAPRAAQRANERAISAVAVAPLVAPGPNGSTMAGLAFSMRF